ncbi:MAG: ligase-associated DNA damage response DEXH box helicase [Planctomycetes bacterium]|nr:ligase-associated DNA damage response DEXH box helicase [Planctomycetota bacterium]
MQLPPCLASWFDARGWKAFAFQKRTWEAYADGQSGLVHAPTGVGKTYAVWLGPLIEWLAEHADSFGAAGAQGQEEAKSRARRASCAPLRVLWITPLRALAADTVEALRAPLNELRIPWSVEPRTGDTSAAARARQRERLPTALVTTPESLSLFLTHASTRETFSTLRCVIVDEWHELLSTKRGVQTELALARLRAWLPNLCIWGLSATLGNLDQARQVLLGSDAQRGVLISGEMPKRYRVDTLIPRDIGRFPWYGHVGATGVEGVVAAVEGARSTLLFTNTRSQAEIWFRLLLTARPDWLGAIALHHGSLSREIRERVEDMLREGKLRCVVCTSSLDLGVDFSPVDQVIQLGSPKGIARLMQRAGRSGHQPGAQSRVLCAPAHAFELVEFAAARAAVAARDIEPRTPLTKSLDVLVQHLVTIALGGGFVPDELYEEVRSSHAYRELTREEWGWAMEFVLHGGDALRAYPQHARVVQEDGRCVVRSRMVERLHRLSIGTITSDATIAVRTTRGGRLGTIEESFIGRLRPGDVFVFAGKTLELVRVHGMTATVRPVKKSRGVVPRWNGARFPLSTQLAQAVRRRLDEARRGEFADAEMRAVRPLLELQAEWSRLPEPGQVLIEHTFTREGWHYYLFPFEGRLAHEGLAALLAYRLTQREPRSLHLSANDYGLELLSPTELLLAESDWRELLRLDGVTEDLLACLNVTQLARRQFRDIARIAGLIFSGYPGAPRLSRHLQASSELYFDVFNEFDAENLLLDQARREVLDQQLEVRRIREALERTAAAALCLVETRELSPLAFPLWAERLRTQYVSSESWAQRVQRMSATLERAAGAVKRPGRRAGTPAPRDGARPLREAQTPS